MSSFELVPTNPAEVAADIAMGAFEASDIFARNDRDYQVLSALEREAEVCGFTDEQYLVEARKAFSIPASFDASGPVVYRDFPDLMFEGTFRGYSKVMIGRIIGAGSVRAFCLNFEEVTIVPSWEHPPEDHLFCVPVLAIEEIDQTS